MRLLILVSLISLTACSKKPAEIIYLVPQFEGETLTPCALSRRVVRTANEAAALAVENLQSALCANSKIEAIAKVLQDPAPGDPAVAWHSLKRTAPQ